MSSNIHGIFASTINGNVSTGVNAVRGWDDAKCRRVYRACVAVLPAEEVAFVRESFTNRYDYSQSQLESYMSSHRITAGQAWCCRMLLQVEHFDVARLLAEREHRLSVRFTEQVYDEEVRHRADLDAARARIAELEKSDALLGRHADLVEQMEAREAEHLQRIVELEAVVAGKDELVESLRYDVAKLEATESAFAETDAALRRREAAHLQRIAELEGQYSRRVQSHTEDLKDAHEREAAHLAHIKAPRSAAESACVDLVEGREWETLTTALADTAHYDVEGGGGCTHGARVWNVIDQTMRCKVCDDAKAGAR